MRALVLAALLWASTMATSPNASDASFHTGESLLDLCRNETNEGFEIACHGYIAGVVDTWMESAGAAAVVMRRLKRGVDYETAALSFAGFCFYGTVSLRQLSEVTIAYLEANPKLWHQPAAFVVREAFADAFPCRD